MILKFLFDQTIFFIVESVASKQFITSRNCGTISQRWECSYIGRPQQRGGAVEGVQAAGLTTTGAHNYTKRIENCVFVRRTAAGIGTTAPTSHSRPRRYTERHRWGGVGVGGGARPRMDIHK